MKKIFIILFLLLTVTQAQNIDECKVDLYYATDIILPEDEDHSEEVWKTQSRELLKKYPQLKERIGERKVAYNISEGVISDLFVKTKENSVAGITWTAFRIWAAAYIKSKATKFIIAQADAASLMIYNNTLQKQIDSYNKSIESGHGVVVVAHSLGNLFTEGVFRKFEENDEKWKQDYFHTISIASTQSDIINGGHGVTFDNDIVYLAELLKANEDVKIRNPNRHDWGYKNAVNEYVLNEDFWSSEYHKFEYYLGYTVMETTRILEGYNTVESKPRQTNIAKDMIVQWIYDEIVAHETRDSQWETDQESNKDTKDYKITVKHKFDPSNLVMNQEVYPFNIAKKLYSINGEYVKASCGGKNITESDDSWMIDNPEEEKINNKIGSKTKATLAFHYVYNCAGEVAGLKFKIYTTKNGASKLIHTEDFNGFYTENRTPDNNWIIKDGNLFKDANLYGNLGNDTIGGWQSKVLYEVNNKDDIASLINNSWTPEIYKYIEVNRSAGGGAGGVGSGGHVGIGWGNHGDNCSLPVIDYKVQTARMQTISVDQATIDKILKEF